MGFTVGSVRFKRYLVSIIPVSYSFFCSYLLKAHMFCCILAGRACSQVLRDQHTMNGDDDDDDDDGDHNDDDDDDNDDDDDDDDDDGGDGGDNEDNDADDEHDEDDGDGDRDGDGAGYGEGGFDDDGDGDGRGNGGGFRFRCTARQFRTCLISLIWSADPLIHNCGVTFMQRVHPICRNPDDVLL